MNKKNNQEIQVMPAMQMQPNKLFITDCGDHVLYEYYLVGNIGDPDEYLDLCHALRSTHPEDRFVIRINSGGGQVRSGNQIINALAEAECTTIGFIENDCGSMATYIFLACDTWGVSDSAEFFAHTCSYGSWGKENENFSQAEFMRKQQHKIMRQRYKSFLLDEEIEKVIAGSDIYLDADEIMDRLELFAEARKENMEEQQEEGQTLDEMIAEAVEKGVKAELDRRERAQSAQAKKAVKKQAPKEVEIITPSVQTVPKPETLIKATME